MQTAVDRNDLAGMKLCSGVSIDEGRKHEVAIHSHHGVFVRVERLNGESESELKRLT